MLATVQTSHTLSQWNRYGTPGLIVPSTAADEINLFGPICTDDDADFWKWFYKTDYHTSDVAFKQKLAECKAQKIKLRFNSPGGNVWAGSTIRQAVQEAIKAGKEIESWVDGLAASAAGIIAVACPKIVMADLGAFMIHRAAVGYDAWGYGNEEDLQIVINEFESSKQGLKEINETQVKIFMEKMKKPREEVQQLLRKETWFNAENSVKAGLATEVFTSDIELPEPQQAALPAAFEPTPNGGIAVSQPAYRFAAAAGLSREQLSELMRSGEGDSTGQPAKPDSQATTEPTPPAPPQPQQGVVIMTDAEVREVLGLSAGMEVTDEHRRQASAQVMRENRELKADKKKAERKAAATTIKAFFDKQVERGAMTPVAAATVQSQILLTPNPEEMFELQKDIYEGLPDGDDDGETARTAQGEGKAAAGLMKTEKEKRVMAYAFKRKVDALEKQGWDIGAAQDQVMEELGEPHLEAYCDFDFDNDPEAPPTGEED